MFFFLIDAALAVGAVLLLIQQYQTGFQGAKRVGAELVRGLYRVIGTPTPEEQVDEVIGSLGRHTEAVRREVAKVRAYHQQFVEFGSKWDAGCGFDPVQSLVYLLVGSGDG